MRVLKYRTFHQWAKSEKLADSSLKNVIDEIEQGLYDANLGGGLYKKRIAKKGQGKRSGYRTILAFKQDNRAVFIYGFSKSERENITTKEEFTYKELAKYLLEITDNKVNTLIKDGKLFEVIYEKK